MNFVVNPDNASAKNIFFRTCLLDFTFDFSRYLCLSSSWSIVQWGCALDPSTSEGQSGGWKNKNKSKTSWKDRTSWRGWWCALLLSTVSSAMAWLPILGMTERGSLLRALGLMSLTFFWNKWNIQVLQMWFYILHYCQVWQPHESGAWRLWKPLLHIGWLPDEQGGWVIPIVSFCQKFFESSHGQGGWY